MKNLDGIETALKLKQILRQGWLNAGIQHPESVADHTFGVAILSLLLPIPDGIDRDKLLRMAMFHDLAEVIIGDIVWETGYSQDLALKEKKVKSELHAIDELGSLFDSDEYRRLALEYIEQKTPEAQFLKQLDKLEMGIQAKIYAEKHHEIDIRSFMKSTAKYVKDPSLTDLLIDILDK